MHRTRRRAISYVAFLLAVTAIYTVAYKHGMAAFEGESRSYLAAFHIVVETFTTTGYGEDAPWQSTQMLALVVMMQLTGIFLIFLTLPLFVVPWVERRMEVNPPTSFDGEDHVVISGFSPRTNALIDELEAQSVEYVVTVNDRDRGRELYEDGFAIAVTDPETSEGLASVDIESARAIVLDRDEETNASIALSVREVADSVPVVAFIDEADLAPYLRLAGVDEVLLPRDLLGQGLADKVTSAINVQLGDTVDVGGELEIIELPVQKGCGLDGVTLADSGVRERTGANVIGVWIEGSFYPNPDPETLITRNSVLLVSGKKPQLEAMMEITTSPGRTRTKDVIIAGYGEVGRTVQEKLSAAHISCTVVDENDQDGVDVVGDATDEETLRRAGIDEAGALILALGEDSDAVFATLVARETNSEVEIICRANDTANVSKLYAAGADYVLALATVSGRMLAESILGEDVISYETQIDIVRTDAPGFAGQTLGEAGIRARTGCTVIAVERNGAVYTDLGSDFEIGAEDSLVIAGTDEDIATFHEVSGIRPGDR